MELTYESQLLEPTDDITQWIKDKNTRKIGMYYELMLIISMMDLDTAMPTILALSPSKIIAVAQDGDTHEERMDISRQAGRLFAEEFDHPITYVVQNMATWIGSGTSDCTATDDPHRTEGAMTFVSDVSQFYTAADLESHMAAIKDWPQFLWHTTMREGTVQEVVNDGTPVVPTSCEEVPEDSIAMDNFGMTECLIGLSAAFPAIQNIKNDPEQVADLDRQVAEKEAAEAST